MLKIISLDDVAYKHLIKCTVEYNGKTCVGFIPKSLYSIFKNLLSHLSKNDNFILRTYLESFDIKPDREYTLWIPEMSDIYSEYLFDVKEEEKQR